MNTKNKLDTAGFLRVQALVKFKRVRVLTEVLGNGQFYMELRLKNRRIGSKVWNTPISWTGIAAEAERILKDYEAN